VIDSAPSSKLTGYLDLLGESKDRRSERGGRPKFDQLLTEVENSYNVSHMTISRPR